MFFPVEMCCKYVGGSKNRGTPNHPKLDHFSIETHGDLGYHHFRNSPCVANMYTQCIYVTCTTWHRMQLSRRAHTDMWDPCVSMISLAFVFEEESMNPGAHVDRTTSPGCLNIFIMFSQGSMFSISRSLVLPPKWLDKFPACTFCSLNPHWFGFWKKEVPVNVLRNPILDNNSVFYPQHDKYMMNIAIMIVIQCTHYTVHNMRYTYIYIHIYIHIYIYTITYMYIITCIVIYT